MRTDVGVLTLTADGMLHHLPLLSKLEENDGREGT